MKKLLRPANIAFYFLMLIVFFFVGVYTAAITGVVKNQMLAGSAIVLGWGIMFAGIAFVVSFFIARILSHKIIVRLNWVLLGLLVIAYGITHYCFLERQKEKEKEEIEKDYPKKVTVPAVTIQTAMHTNELVSKNTIVSRSEAIQISESDMGIGFFKPDYFEYPSLYFYSGINLEKALTEHMPVDSVVFANDKYNNPTTTYAPPWLYPEHLKLDYGIIIFKVMGIGRDFIKVEVNKQNKLISYLNKTKGSFMAWHEFILSINSVEFVKKSTQTIHVRPLDYAGELKVEFAFMQPLLVEEDWMYVKLVNESFVEQAKGWIRWKKDNKLLITYSILS